MAVVNYDPFRPEDWDRLFGLSASVPTIARYTKRMFLPLRRMIADYASEHASERSIGDFKTLVAPLDTEKCEARYADLQRRHLNADAIRHVIHDLAHPFAVLGAISPSEKYFDLPYWLHGKLKIAQRLGLPKGARRSVLDIGSGAGYFGFVCQAYGHDYLGIDKSMKADWPQAPRHMFDDLSDLLRVNRVHQEIAPLVPLEVDRRFELLTCWMGNFCVVFDESGRYVRNWSWPEWTFLLQDLRDNVLTEQFEIHLSLGHILVDDDVADAMCGIALKHNPDKRAFVINQDTMRIG